MAKSGSPTTEATSGGRAGETREALLRAAVEALREVGFAGASARAIARRADCNQSLVFYHFGSVTGLLLAALDRVSDARLEAYRRLVAEESGSLGGLIEAARDIFLEDLEAGHVTVLVEMMAAAQSVPGLAPEVARRIEPWRTFVEDAIGDVIARSPLAALFPVADATHAVLAGFLGLELLAHLEGDTAGALSLFTQAARATALLGLPSASRPGSEEAE